MDLPETLRRSQVELGHVPLLGQVPVTAGVIFEERATVQLDRPLIVIDSRPEMAGDPVCVCLAEFGKELVAVTTPGGGSARSTRPDRRRAGGFATVRPGCSAGCAGQR